MTICKDCGEKYAVFNYAGLKPRYCKQCKLEEMIDTKNKKCIIENCNLRASYGDKEILYCKKHSNGAILSKYKRCIMKNCKLSANFNLKNSTKGLYCKKHSTADMINVKKLLYLCNEENCQTRASFGFIRYKPLYCKFHIKIGMRDVVSKQCLYQNCNKNPVFGDINKQIREYCFEHKPIEYINLTRHKI